MKKIISALFIISLCLYLTACQTPIRVNHNVDTSINFVAFKTFVMAPPPEKAPENMPGYSPIVAKDIQNEIAGIVAEKGYRQVDRIEEADMVVSFSISDQLRTQFWGVTGWGWSGTGSINSTDYISGTLVIDFYEVTTKSLFWHGWAMADFFEYKQNTADGSRAIQKILKSFPAAE